MIQIGNVIVNEKYITAVARHYTHADKLVVYLASGRCVEPVCQDREAAFSCLCAFLTTCRVDAERAIPEEDL